MTRPSRAPRPTETGHRAPTPLGAVRAGYHAHLSDTHAGTPDPDCRTCASYLHGLADAAVLTRTHTTRTHP